MGILFLDPAVARKARELFVTNGGTSDPPFTEMWDGVEVVPPQPNDEHQELAMRLMVPLYEVVQAAGLGQVRPPVNVSDRDDQWEHNYRGPDVVVYLATNPAVNHGTHWEGGPDFLIEIISPGERPRDKFAFYAAIGTREVMLIVDRFPWVLELYQLRGGRLALAGRSDDAAPAAVASSVLPLTFRLQPGTLRPVIEMTHTGTGQVWPA